MYSRRTFLVLAGLTWCLAGLTSVSAVAQSNHDPDDAAEVLDYFIEALGGEMTLSGIETLTQKVTYTGWTEATSEFSYKDGKSLDLTDISGTKGYDNLYDGEKWMARTPHSPAKVVTDKESLQTKEASFDLPTDALRLREQAELMEVVPKDEYADTEYSEMVCLRLKDDEGMNILRYFDPDTGLLQCIERWVDQEGGEPRHMQIRYFNFKYEEAEGIMFLKTSRRTTGDDSFLDCVYSDIQVDQPVDDSLFDFEVDDD